MNDEEDTYSSVHWAKNDDEQDAAPPSPDAESSPALPRASSSTARPAIDGSRRASLLSLKPEGYFTLEVRDPIKELENTKDAFISYAVVGETALPMYSDKTFRTRRRFQDFVFLRDHLAKDFPACVVPPLPDKHRMEYLTGDRFSDEFVQKRKADLQRFLQRLSRHPTLSRATLLQSFLESTEWNVRMHQHLAHPPAPETHTMLDNISDTLLNAFAKLRKPDERFVEIKESLDRFDNALNGIDRIQTRLRARVGDLSNDYDDFSGSIQGLGYLETGITDPLTHFETSLLDFSQALKDIHAQATSALLDHLHSLQGYSAAFRAVLKLRDQKQLDFEELSGMLAQLTNERDRLSAGVAPISVGVTSYFKAKVESLRGNELTRDERIHKLDVKIKEMQDVVTTAHETSDSINDEVLKEYEVFQLAKRLEMRELLDCLADGHIALSRATIAAYAKCIPPLESIRSG